jgi:1-acyl-sn-glycerol-3-phosphate acyltransferase
MSPHAAPLVPAETQAPPRRVPLVRRVIKAVIGPYLRAYHGLELLGTEHIPARGPALVVINHASLLDVPVLMLLDPWPDTATLVKASLFKVPVLSWLLRQWGAIPVERQGRDSSGVRAMLQVLRSGGVMTIAVEGRRTRSGHLEAVNPILARFAANAGVPILPVGIGGSFDALPPGRVLPRPKKIVVRVGPTFRLDRGTDAAQAAQRISREIAALLPPQMQPLASPS